MKKIIKCVDENCGHAGKTRKRLKLSDEWIYRTTLGIERVVRGQGYMVLCLICD